MVYSSSEGKLARPPAGPLGDACRAGAELKRVVTETISESVLVTGGAGFIGSNFVLEWIKQQQTPLVNYDLLTYAGNPRNLRSLTGEAAYRFVHGDICDGAKVRATLAAHRPRAIVHFAAESHVDRSIVEPDEFLRTNITGTYRMLEAALGYWRELGEVERAQFRFVHVSTDEVYGSLRAEEPAFTEHSQYAPNSPYAASKASSDHLVRAWHHTYGLPTLITNCSNNYGPFQFPEKLMPLMILHALEEKPLPIYGDGQNVRDWLFVEDHCTAIRAVLERGRPGEVYNIGGESERTNLEVVGAICDLLDEMRPAGEPRRRLMTYVQDRPGHDRRYAINAAKISGELGWRPQVSFEEGLRRTIGWYLENMDWVRDVRTGAYLDWMDRNYGDRAKPAGGERVVGESAGR